MHAHTHTWICSHDMLTTVHIHIEHDFIDRVLKIMRLSYKPKYANNNNSQSKRCYHIKLKIILIALHLFLLSLYVDAI